MLLPLRINHSKRPIPTELGRATSLTSAFVVRSNHLCNLVPTEVQALSGGVTNWNYNTLISMGNHIGTPCWKITSNGDVISLSDTSLVFENQGLKGSLPTEWGLMSLVTKPNLAQNHFDGPIPSQVSQSVVLPPIQKCPVTSLVVRCVFVKSYNISVITNNPLSIDSWVG